MISYLVNWGNGFIGGYDKKFEQLFNTPKQDIFDDMLRCGVNNLKIITPQQLDELRGYHKPTSQEYFANI